MQKPKTATKFIGRFRHSQIRTTNFTAINLPKFTVTSKARKKPNLSKFKVSKRPRSDYIAVKLSQNRKSSLASFCGLKSQILALAGAERI